MSIALLFSQQNISLNPVEAVQEAYPSVEAVQKAYPDVEAVQEASADAFRRESLGIPGKERGGRKREEVVDEIRLRAQGARHNLRRVRRPLTARERERESVRERERERESVRERERDRPELASHGSQPIDGTKSL